jgi:hypothetical protein
VEVFLKQATSHDVQGAFMLGSASHPGHPALREGLMFGTILGIFEIVSGLLQNLVGLHSLNTVFAAMFFVLIIALNLLAGVRASQQTGRVSTGAYAGLIVVLISSVFGTINILADIFVFDTILHRWLLQATSGQTQKFYTNQFVTLAITELIIGFVVMPLLGAVIGAIGGMIGIRGTKLPMQV